MSSRSRASLVAVAALLLLCCGADRPLRAQVARDSSFAVVVTLGGGYSRYIAPYEEFYGISRDGAAGTLRLMWKPDHLLRVGLESGWTSMYSYTLKDVQTQFGKTDANLFLSAIPVLVVFSMEVARGVELFGGTGVYYVNLCTRSFGETVNVREFSQGWMLAASYSVPLSASFCLSLEAKWLGATQFGDAAVSTQLQARYRLLEW
ncbi:MAG: hypothetical protein IPP94_18855 [Ignavibacteria bacterium]|nr:hypothetical protein [Ignavibacteria bacterium]